MGAKKGAGFYCVFGSCKPGHKPLMGKPRKTGFMHGEGGGKSFTLHTFGNIGYDYQVISYLFREEKLCFRHFWK